MQIDAYLKKEQIGTLFVLVGAPEGGLRGGGARGSSSKIIRAYPKKIMAPPAAGVVFYCLRSFFVIICIYLYLSKTSLPVRLLSQCKLPHLPLH